jgi:hypothetical protein
MSDADLSPPAEVQYARDVQPIWNDYCVGCHDTHLQIQGAWLDLRPGKSWQSLQGSTWFCAQAGGAGGESSLIVAGDPDHSAVWMRLAYSAPECYGPMPSAGGGLLALDPQAADTVRRWIAAGGKND